MKFASRQDAGRRLGKFLSQCDVSADIVLGLPRGGAVVAAEVARELGLPLDVLVVRKIGHPLQREFAIGAIAEPDVLMLDETAITEFPVPRYRLDEVIAEETVRLNEYRSRFRDSKALTLNNKTVLLVDDGLATGATAEAAVFSVSHQKPRGIIVAAPVASTAAYDKLSRAADKVVVLVADPDFGSVGQYYENFAQTTDEEVVALLRNAVR